MWGNVCFALLYYRSTARPLKPTTRASFVLPNSNPPSAHSAHRPRPTAAVQQSLGKEGKKGGKTALRLLRQARHCCGVCVVRYHPIMISRIVRDVRKVIGERETKSDQRAYLLKFIIDYKLCVFVCVCDCVCLCVFVCRKSLTDRMKTTIFF